MIPKVTSEKISYCVRAQKPNGEGEDEELETKVLDSNMKTRALAAFHRTADAFIEYPAKGLRGDVNSNFYEFLAMGRVPYLVGSATFIGVFNAVSKYFDARGAQQARAMGLKLAIGVVLYGLAKTLSKDLVSRPVAWATGVDLEQPYLNITTPFPKVTKCPPKPGENLSDMVEDMGPVGQYQKLWESKEFPRIDLVDTEFHDKVARKNGLGTGLNCAENETKPIIKNIISTATTAQRVSSFLWAACGVALAACGDWDKYYDTYLSGSKLGRFVPDKNLSKVENFKNWLGKSWENTRTSMGALKDTICNSAKELYNGVPGSTGFKKHAGKALVWTAAGSTIFGVANTIIRARMMGKNLCNEKVIDNSKDSVAV